MSALGFLVPLAVVLGGTFVGLFIVALRQGQWEDLDGAARRAIEDDTAPPRLPPDPLEGLTGDALHEALVYRAVGVAPPEVDALRAVGELRARLAACGPDAPEAEALRKDLARAELEAAMLSERSGRMLAARGL
jgi:cbb3-type cytochrome oxidase maturation protein